MADSTMRDKRLKYKELSADFSVFVCLHKNGVFLVLLFVIIGRLSFLLSQWALVYVGVLTSAQENESSANGS